MIQKIALYIQFFFIIIASIYGPIMFFTSEDRDFVFAQKEEVVGIIENVLTVDSIYYDYEIVFAIKKQNIKDTISTYTFYHSLVVGDSVTILSKASDPHYYRYKEKFDYFLTIAPLFWPLMIIIPLILSVIQKRIRKKNPPINNIEKKKLGFNELDLNSNFKLVIYKKFISMEKWGFIIGLVLGVPFITMYTVAVFVLEDIPSAQMLKEYWMVIGFVSILLAYKIVELKRMPIEVIADNKTVSIKLLWKKEVIQVKREIVELKLGSKMIQMLPKLKLKIDSDFLSYSLDGMKYITETFDEESQL